MIIEIFLFFSRDEFLAEIISFMNIDRIYFYNSMKKIIPVLWHEKLLASTNEMNQKSSISPHAFPYLHLNKSVENQTNDDL